jgi:hypothetical protein
MTYDDFVFIFIKRDSASERKDEVETKKIYTPIESFVDFSGLVVAGFSC